MQLAHDGRIKSMIMYHTKALYTEWLSSDQDKEPHNFKITQLQEIHSKLGCGVKSQKENQFTQRCHKVPYNPTIQNIYPAVIPKSCTTPEILTNADDAVIITHSKNQNFGERYLQKATDELMNWIDKPKIKKIHR